LVINLVIDASAGVELLLNTADGRTLTAKLPAEARSWVPEHYFIEAGSVLRRFERKGVISPARTAIAFHDLLHGDMRRAQVRPLMEAAWRNRGHLTVADAVYVILAEQLKATLVTADRNLANSPGLKVPTITP
jgi:predicted nucleic acid-binding protein